MKIKNIQEFRTYWKNKENFVGFDENFIGTKHDDVNGFYRIVNGTVHDIKADLTPKLQNAQDEQAIYEFLQNAADSNSDDCAIIYDEDYFMVLNNGEPFTTKDVEAILNSFQGTKADKSQKENCGKIGRYGIGFKLVHRLVGKSDGAKELIENLNGPVIFSWFKENQIKSLFDYQINQNISIENQIDDDESSWLFKIALTCFPTMPKEKVKNIDYDETIIYKNDELLELVNFLNKHKAKINNLNLNKGSLFFLKFGENKHQKLEESFKNINSGIGYSLNTLKTLDKVILQENLVERIDIERIDFKIYPKEEAFLKIDPEFPDCPIDIMFGFRTDNYEALRTAPNIYQFFPMRNEAHGLSFFVHASSFAKVTDRTKLDDQGESNIHTLSYLSNELQVQLNSDFQINEKEKARNIFKSVIFSEISERQNSELVVNNLLLPLNDYFKKNVPTKFGDFLPYDDVLIRATKLNIEPSDFGIEKEWIYWSSSNENRELIKEIKEKLEVKKWNIGKLIENGITSEINTWLAQIEDDQYLLFLEELNEHIPKENFDDIEFIKCRDDYFYSINDLTKHKEVIIEFDKLSNIQNILIELEFTVSNVNISKYPMLKLELAKSIPYLSETQEVRLFENYIYASTSENELSPTQKRDLFLCMKGLHGVGQTLLSEFELFSNAQNEIKPLNLLVDSKISLPDFLEEYKILDSENIFDEIRKGIYLRNYETIYGSIIYPEWNNIIDNIWELNSFNVELFYEKVCNYYLLANTDVNTLDEENYIFVGDEFNSQDDIFYHSKFIDFSKYNNLSSAIEILTGFKTPKKSILKYLNEKPFKTSKGNIEKHLESGEIDFNDAKSILNFSKEIGLSLFEYGYFENYNSVLYFNHDNQIKNYYSKNKSLIAFIEENLSQSFHILPDELIEFKKDILRNSDLQQEILNKLEGDTNEYIEILVELLTGDNFDKLIDESEEIHVGCKQIYTVEDFEYKLFDKINDRQIEILREKLVIEYNGDEFYLNQATFLSKISFNDKYELELSKVLPNSKRFENATILSNISKSLIDAGINENKILKVFDIQNETDYQLYKEILDELLENENSLVKSEYQLAYVLLYNQYVKIIDLAKIEAYHINNEIYAINYSLYINEYPFISQSETLDERYWKIGKILKLNKSNQVFIADSSNCKILLKPYFNKEEQLFVCDNIKSELEIAEQKALFNFLFNYWGKFNENKRAVQGINWSKFGETDAVEILGFEPNKTIWENKLAKEEEKCPQWLKRWGNTSNDRLNFLSDLGVITETSIIHKIRLGLSSNYVFEEQLRIKENEEGLLKSSFDWIIEKELKFKNKRKFELLKRISDRFEIKFDTTLNEEKLEENCIPFDNLFDADYYKKWSKEFGYSICFYTDEMPYRIQYNDYTLKEISQGNIEMIDDTIFLNKEYFKSETDLIKINSTNEFLSPKAEKELFKHIVHNNSNFPADLAELEKENELLKKKLQEATEPDKGQGKGNASKERQKAQSYETKLKAKEILSARDGFDCSNWSDNHIPSTIIKGVKYFGDEITLIIRSAISGSLHLHPNEWILFDDPNTFLVVRIGENDFVVIGNNENIKETLKEENETISVNFDINSFGIEGIDSLSKVLSGAYLVGTGYVFNSPSFSYSNKLEDLGQSIINNALISGKSDDEF